MMAPVLPASPSQTFIHELRSALNHLYDPDFLRASPLAVMFGVAGRFDTPSTLQDILTRSIEALKPGPNASNKLYAQAVYDLLLYRYVQQFNQNEIANQLGISVRHLRRQQNLAVYELAGLLWKQYRIRADETPDEASQGPTNPAPVPDQFAEELVWLQHSSGSIATDLSLALETAQQLIQPFAEQKEAHLVFPSLENRLAQVHPVAFQQILLTLLTAAIQNAPGQEVLVDAVESQGWQAVSISAPVSSGHPTVEEEDPGTLETVRKIVEISQGVFSFEIEKNTFRARVAFRTIVPRNVLVIDDNPEIVMMMQRFVAETAYRIFGLHDPNNAIEYALEKQPDLIVIDIMMPQVDGLQVLSRFKHHPVLGKLPVIICSVLPQKNLSASLGAIDFIQKPIQREPFIAALERALDPK